MDNIIQIEILLNFINDLLAKSVAFNDDKIEKELSSMRRQIYYGIFEFDEIVETLKTIGGKLKKYDQF